ncbi:hypothetical protein TrLO_g13956 [Triparma laevis f. longispina]|uniref:Uncharacterized protein n=1 Tax=Triparma laevis f. longispina TaxID=1714387 RepID=A0A9W7CFI2_9STRA|nr:hypothetical protein TrLO_g13956 [Triparma laevis f. longispina]
MGALFSAHPPQTDSVGDQFVVLQCIRLRPGDRICKTPSWRTRYDPTQPSDGFVEVSSSSPDITGESGAFGSSGWCVEFKDGTERLICARSTRFKCVPR